MDSTLDGSSSGEDSGPDPRDADYDSDEHAELLALDGWYAAQWRYQQLEAALEAARRGLVQP